MQKKFKIKNFILKSITWIVVIVFLLVAMACDDMELRTSASVMCGCLAWICLYCMANHFFRGCE